VSARYATDPLIEAQRAGEEFDSLLRASVARAEEKRKARLYPYDLEVTS
jgi:hypothetical protein